MKHRCPICDKVISSSLQDLSKKADFFPFCSSRCKFIDLGAWLDGDYRIIPKSQSENSRNGFDGENATEG